MHEKYINKLVLENKIPKQGENKLLLSKTKHPNVIISASFYFLLLEASFE